MKPPKSHITSEKLADLFQKSSLKERYFFPKQVPSLSMFDNFSTQAKLEQQDESVSTESKEELKIPECR